MNFNDFNNERFEAFKKYHMLVMNMRWGKILRNRFNDEQIALNRDILEKISEIICRIVYDRKWETLGLLAFEISETAGDWSLCDLFPRHNEIEDAGDAYRFMSSLAKRLKMRGGLELVEKFWLELPGHGPIFLIDNLKRVAECLNLDFRNLNQVVFQLYIEYLLNTDESWVDNNFCETAIEVIAREIVNPSSVDKLSDFLHRLECINEGRYMSAFDTRIIKQLNLEGECFETCQVALANAGYGFYVLGGDDTPTELFIDDVNCYISFNMHDENAKVHYEDSTRV